MVIIMEMRVSTNQVLHVYGPIRSTKEAKKILEKNGYKQRDDNPLIFVRHENFFQYMKIHDLLSPKHI
jgi:hypothetical protein